MGLTIHYNLEHNGTTKEIRTLIGQLYQYAKTLPFKKLYDIVEIKGNDCDFNKNNYEEIRWLLIQSQKYMDTGQSVSPSHIIAFTTWPGEGCESANFGLCKYPKTKGWSWGSFCKTQYASDNEHGGVKNFLKCHLLVVKMLDFAKQINILKSVSDESDFWDKRDLKALAQEVGEWNCMIAGFVGKLKDMFGDDIEAPILKFSNFEHLEADCAKNSK